MITPRSQCLNVAKQVSQGGKRLKATFTTSSSTARADGPSRNSATDDLLAAAGERSPSRLRSQPASTSDLFSALKTARPEPTRSFNFRSSPSTANLNSNPIQSRNAPQAQKSRAPLMNIQRLLEGADARKAAQAVQAAGAKPKEVSNVMLGQNLNKRIWRKWKAGDTYAPHDLSHVEQDKWSRRQRPQFDAFDMLAMNPIDHYRNFSIMSEYMTPMGRIMHRNETGLRPVNQRRIAKAIRRTIGMGIMPSVHRHPELLYQSRKAYAPVRGGGMPRLPS